MDVFLVQHPQAQRDLVPRQLDGDTNGQHLGRDSAGPSSAAGGPGRRGVLHAAAGGRSGNGSAHAAFTLGAKGGSAVLGCSREGPPGSALPPLPYSRPGSAAGTPLRSNPPSTFATPAGHYHSLHSPMLTSGGQSKAALASPMLLQNVPRPAGGSPALASILSHHSALLSNPQSHGGDGAMSSCGQPGLTHPMPCYPQNGSLAFGHQASGGLPASQASPFMPRSLQHAFFNPSGPLQGLMEVDPDAWFGADGGSAHSLAPGGAGPDVSLLDYFKDDTSIYVEGPML